MKKLFIVLMLLFFLSFVINMKRNNEDVLEDKTSSIKKQEIVTKSKKLDGNATKTNSILVEKKRTKENNIAKNFNDFKEIEVREIQNYCREYLYQTSFGENYLDIYKEKYKKYRKVLPNKQQLIAMKKIMNYCDKYSEFQNELANKYYENDTSLNKIFSQIVIKEGSTQALKYAEDNLFDEKFSIRSSAWLHLLNKEWLNSVHDTLNLPEQQNIEGFIDTMSMAVNMRECELGFFDCSLSSVALQSACKDKPLACNVTDYRSFIELALTGYQIELLEKYMIYLRTLSSR